MTVSACGSSAGPIDSEVRRLLSELLDGVLSIQVVQRSPVGLGAVKIAIDHDPATAAIRLKDESWVEAIAIRPKHLYLKLETNTLCSWVATRYEGRSARGGLNATSPDDSIGTTPPESLTVFRRSAVAMALSRILAAPEADNPDVPVGGIDVRFGALRMRHGGIVSVGDAAAEIAQGIPGPLGSPGSDRALDALAVLVLSTHRERHVHIDDEWIRRGATALGHLAEGFPRSPGDDTGRHLKRDGAEADQAVRRLAIELNALPRYTSFAETRLDPSYLARFALSIAARSSAARLGPADPLRDAVRVALRLSLGLLRPSLGNLLSKGGLKPGEDEVAAQAARASRPKT